MWTLLLALSAAPLQEDRPAARLTGHGVLPARTLAPGAPSGARVAPSVAPALPRPFDGQPVQGVSALVSLGGDEFLALLDNGYGALENSADFELCVHRVRVDWRRGVGGRGEVELLERVPLRDPDGHLGFAIQHSFDPERPLSGADFDPESMALAPDGTLWIGEEFGPFLLHFDATGVLLAPPLHLPDPFARDVLRSPQYPFAEDTAALRMANALRAHGLRVGSTGEVRVSPDRALVKGSGLELPSRRDGGDPVHLPPASSALVDVALFARAGFEVVPYTVNDAGEMDRLLALGVAGLISDSPDVLYARVAAFDADGDGRGGDLLLPDGSIDAARFDAQGHRGARDLAPENTLVGFELALDHGMTTLELDVGVTADGVAVLCHEPELLPAKLRRSDGTVWTEPLAIRGVELAWLQAELMSDVVLRDRPRQSAEATDVARAFAVARGLKGAYTPPSLADVFAFVDFYGAWYREGPGASHPEAARRAALARRVRVHAETKRDPGEPGRTVEPSAFFEAILAAARDAGALDRLRVQSFDLATLLEVQRRAPGVDVTLLLGDFPSSAGGGTNLQSHRGVPSPWFAGLPWPYRRDLGRMGANVGQSAGLEGLCLTADGERLVAALERPFADGGRSVWLFEFDLMAEAFADAFSVLLEDERHAVGALAGTGDGAFLLLERDNTEHDLAGFKRVYRVERRGDGVDKRLVVDLMRIDDPDGISVYLGEGALGTGATFAMPFWTIESVVALGPNTLVIANDNNLPFGAGRVAGELQDTEFVRIELGTPLW
ncbi:MAG: hypothetical protein GC161_11025 [Planctomycetaceae bacterium]|nr:hypothetical protein [Planctomycetaceae bacterium]